MFSFILNVGEFDPLLASLIQVCDKSLTVIPATSSSFITKLIFLPNLLLKLISSEIAELICIKTLLYSLEINRNQKKEFE